MSDSDIQEDIFKYMEYMSSHMRTENIPILRNIGYNFPSQPSPYNFTPQVSRTKYKDSEGFSKVKAVDIFRKV